MNRKEKAEIDGRPPIVPPSLVPRRLAIAVAKLIQDPRSVPQGLLQEC